MDTEASHLVERRFLSLEDLKPKEKEFNVSLKIHSTGAWILKFRQSGVIYNRQDLVLTDSIRCDVAVLIKDVLYFHQIMVGEASIADEIKMGNITVQGQPAFVDSFLRRFPKSSHSTGQNGSSLNPTMVNATVPIRENRVLSSEEVPPIKAGWLLKKRDIISGWKCRYFEIYKDRLDYYADQKDVRPRGSYPLYGVEIGSVKPIRVKRRNEHYGLFLELRCPDKTIKLASERTGLEGKVEADSWFQAFQLAAAASDTSKSPTRRKSGTRGNLQSASRQANAASNSNNMASNDSRGHSAGAANSSANNANSQSTTRRAVVGAVARNLMRKMSMVGGGADNYLRGQNADEDNAPFSTLQLVLYGGVILLLAVAVWYAWYVAELLSRKTFITLAILLAVLVFIFVQECVLGDDPQSLHLQQQQQAKESKQVDVASAVAPSNHVTPTATNASTVSDGVITLNSDGDSSNDEDGDDEEEDDEEGDDEASDANSVTSPRRNHSNEPQMNNHSNNSIGNASNAASVNRKLQYPAHVPPASSTPSAGSNGSNGVHAGAGSQGLNSTGSGTSSAPPQLQSPLQLRAKAIDELS